MAQYLIAHDLGTSGDKATLFDVEKGVVRSVTKSYDVQYSGSGYAEQNGDDYWRAVCEATKAVTEGTGPASVIGISFSGQMQGCLPVDREGKPLRPSIIWADSRAVKEAEDLKARVGADRIYEITGHPVSPSYTIEKLMWLKEHEPEVYGNTYRTLHAKDYILLKLTGVFATDYSDASGTNALDLAERKWSDEIIDASGVRADVFPRLYEATDIVGHVTAEAAAQTGLLEGTPVVCGGGDGPCSAVGAGCIHDNEYFSSFGTSAWIGGTMTEKFSDEKHVCMCFGHVIPGRYMPCGTMQTAGSAYSFIRDLLMPGESFETLDRMIGESPAGANGLLFLPYLLGERSPRWNEKATGAFLNMRMEHTRNDFLRAVIEGIACNLELILRTYREKTSVDRLILTGGGARGEQVRRILTDVLCTEIDVADHAEDATSIAAAMIAGVGVGAYDSFEATGRFVRYPARYEPDRENAARYRPVKELFDESYRLLMPFYEQASRQGR